ncbi:hypothetical protein [uncultured Novosphingobium sp.]|uniref:hypothetical protein n=1 Tax=uncultured Novosphingobium sp. TaxID=292277 RepID=UPI0037494C30
MSSGLSYVPATQARDLLGLRLVLNAGVPGPWSEAAKALFYIKGIPFVPVPHKGGMPNEELVAWTGIANAPVAMLDDERPRAHWSEILMLAERLAPEPRLIPQDEALRVQVLGLCHEICGEDGLGWNRRLQLLERSEITARRKAAEKDPTALDRPNVPIARMRFRYSPNGDLAAAEQRILAILAHLDAALAANRAKGADWLVGERMTAADIYWTAFSNMFVPIPHDRCPMPDFYREAALVQSAAVSSAVTADLLDHRDKVAAICFENPMRF